MYLQHFAVSITSPRLPYLQQYLQQVPGYRSSFTQPNDYFHMFLDKKHDKTNYGNNESLFSTKKNEIALNVSYDKMKQYIGLLLHLLFI